MGDTWGADGPPDEAYSRLSGPERYRPLHALARAAIRRLTEDFDVREEAAVASDPHGPGQAEAVRLVPSDPAAAALTVVFTSFPGLEVLSGHDDRQNLPTCGCDACDESVDDCENTLRQRLYAVTHGTFGERLVRDRDGWSHERWYEAGDGAWSSRTPVSRAERQALAAALPRTWAPWPEKISPADVEDGGAAPTGG